MCASDFDCLRRLSEAANNLLHDMDMEEAMGAHTYGELGPERQSLRDVLNLVREVRHVY